MRGTDRLPKHLGIEPLIDTVFEMRFKGTAAESVLPGYLFGKLDGTVSIEALPVGALPLEIRRANQSLKFQPLVRLHWSRYMLLIGEETLGVACKLPYPGWAAFKTEISNIVTLVLQANVINEITRLSLKYVDLIDGSDVQALSSKLDAQLTIGDINLGKRPFQFQSVIDLGGVENQVAFAAPAAILTGTDKQTKRQGLVITVDSYVEQSISAKELEVAKLVERLDQLHDANKRLFFTCLSDDAITAMEPSYD